LRAEIELIQLHERFYRRSNDRSFAARSLKPGEKVGVTVEVDSSATIKKPENLQENYCPHESLMAGHAESELSLEEPQNPSPAICKQSVLSNYLLTLIARNSGFCNFWVICGAPISA
jgi:hypothetical protein